MWGSERSGIFGSMRVRLPVPVPKLFLPFVVSAGLAAIFNF